MSLTFPQAFAAAMAEGLKAAKSAADGFISSYYDYPSISRHDNDMPMFQTFSSLSDAAPTNYKVVLPGGSPFLFLSEKGPNEADFPAGSDLISVCEKSERITSYFKSRIGSAKGLRRIAIQGLVANCVDRNIHTTGSFELTKSEFSRIARPIYNAINRKTLAVAIMVPIASLRFEFDRLKLGDGIFMMRMNDDLQLARSRRSYYGSGAHRSVVAAATHAFVLRHYQFENDNYDDTLELLSSQWSFPTKDIDNLFASLRLATGHATGYAQLLYYPRRWTLEYYAGLPTVYGATVRRYPSRFDDFGWLRPSGPVSRDDLSGFGELYDSLSKSKSPQIDLAVKRFNACHLRADDEDAVIDATIGLEVLLSDESTQEMTHKLALRVAALGNLYDDQPQSPTDLFKEIKKIYVVRSKIVHGMGSAQTGKKKAQSDRAIADAAKRATRCPGFCIKALLDHPRYLDTARIDRELLLRDSPEVGIATLA